MSNDWICGFVDGEGSFSLTRGQRPRNIPKPQFSIGIATDDIRALEYIRDSIGLDGRLYDKKPATNSQGYTSRPITTLLATTKRDCIRVVEFFKSNDLLLKTEDFAIWSECVDIWVSRDWRGRWTQEKNEASERMRELHLKLVDLHR